MDDKADISLVDSHAKCNRSNNNLNLVLHPHGLDFRTLCIRKCSMIIITLYFVSMLKSFCKLFTVLSTETINDAAFILEPSLH